MQARGLEPRFIAIHRALVAHATVIDPDQHGLERMDVKRQSVDRLLSTHGVRPCGDRDTMAQTHNVETDPMAYNNMSRAILYALSEMGESGTVSADNTTISSLKAYDHKTPVLSAVSVATAQTHVISVHPKIAQIAG
jgi:hypothetical protein